MKSLPKNYLLALIIFIAVLTWIASGFFKSETMDNSLEINNSETVEEKIAVRAKDIYGEVSFSSDGVITTILGTQRR